MQYNSVCRQTALIRLSKKKQISNFGCDLDQLRYTRKGNRNKSESQEAAVQRIRPDNSKRRHQIDPNRMFGLALRYLLPKTSLKKPYLSGLRPLSSATSATKPSIAGKTSGSTSKLESTCHQFALATGLLQMKENARQLRLANSAQTKTTLGRRRDKWYKPRHSCPTTFYQ